MRKFGLFHPLFFSFFSQPLYQDVARNWRGLIFLYLLLALAICWLPLMARLQAQVTKFVEEESPRALQQIPRVTITNGEVSTDVETPYFINDTDTDKPFIIIDLTGEFESLAGTEARVLVTRNQVFVKNKPHETRVYDLSGVKEFSVDRARVEGWLQLVQKWLVVILFPFTVFFAFCYRVMQAFIYGLIGLIFAKILHAPLGYMASVRLAIIAVTPVLILNTVVTLSKVRIPAWWLIGFLIAMGYLFFGVKAATAAPEPGGSPASQPGQATGVSG